MFSATSTYTILSFPSAFPILLCVQWSHSLTCGTSVFCLSYWCVYTHSIVEDNSSNFESLLHELIFLIKYYRKSVTLTLTLATFFCFLFRSLSAHAAVRLRRHSPLYVLRTLCPYSRLPHSCYSTWLAGDSVLKFQMPYSDSRHLIMTGQVVASRVSLNTSNICKYHATVYSPFPLLPHAWYLPWLFAWGW